MTEFDGDPCDCVWEAFWRLATADVPTEILGTYLAARIVPATKPNGGVRPFAHPDRSSGGWFCWVAWPRGSLVWRLVGLLSVSLLMMSVLGPFSVGS